MLHRPIEFVCILRLHFFDVQENTTVTAFVLIDADLLLIWMNKFQLWFRFRHELCLVLPAMLIISRRVVMYYTPGQFCKTALGMQCITTLIRWYHTLVEFDENYTLVQFDENYTSVQFDENNTLEKFDETLCSFQIDGKCAST